MVSAHTMDYIGAATSGTLPPHILPIMDLQKMLLHISDTLPSTLHLSVSPDDTLHFYRYLHTHTHTHILIANKQFLLLIDIPIQDRSQQITNYKVFTLNIPHGNLSAYYDINTKYLALLRMKPWQWNFPPPNFKSAKQQTDNFAACLHLFSH